MRCKQCNSRAQVRVMRSLSRVAVRSGGTASGTAISGDNRETSRRWPCKH